MRPTLWNHAYLLMVAAAMLVTIQACRAEPATSQPTQPVVREDISQPGAYRAGFWEYRLLVTSPGSKSEGTLGKLFFGGKPVPEAVPGDYYHTPWGDVQWAGNPSTLWGEHGWILRTPLIRGGRALAEPWIEAGGPVVMVMVLGAAGASAPAATVEPWVKQELAKLGVGNSSVQRPWFPLNDQALTIHDTKMFGTLTARLSPARDARFLTVLLDGTQEARVDLPRQKGATTLVRRTLGVLEQQDFYLAFRVDDAAPAWPRPLEVGPESEGKEVIVKGAREVIISLPGDKVSGQVWTIKRVQGDAPLSASIQAGGTPQFAPAGGAPVGTARQGHFENVLRVTGTGKSYVELEYKRPWQTDQPAEKTFRVTLDVQEVPASPAATTKP